MFKSAVRAAPRRILNCRAHLSSGSSRRFLSTAPPARQSRSWKSAAARWGLAAAGVYYYNTSNVFAEEPEGNATCPRQWLEKLMVDVAAIQRLDESIHHVQESRQPTIDAIVEEKRQREAQAIAEEKKRQWVAEKSAAKEGQDGHVEEGEEEMEGLEEEADQQGAFNPETGEINWDCPCLGGMAHGPCGEEFKAAFSCFVYSNEEPKGVECIEKFK
jgi:intermembrane space import and assembly protein 40